MGVHITNIYYILSHRDMYKYFSSVQTKIINICVSNGAMVQTVPFECIIIKDRREDESYIFRGCWFMPK